MLDNIRTLATGWVGKALLALITIPFALFGIDSYLNNAGGNVSIAEVNGESISVKEYSFALQNLRNRLQAEGKVDPAQLESPQVKQMVLDQLIDKQLLTNEIKDAKFAITESQLATYITGMPEFQANGKFSEEAYYQSLEQNGLTPTKFEAAIRTDLLSQQANDGFGRLGFSVNSRAEHAYKLNYEKRTVSVAEIKNKDFVNQVNIDDNAVKAYYEKHKAKMLLPEKVKIEFVLLSANSLISEITVSEQEIKQFYDENIEKFQVSEERRASHILIGFGVSASAEQKAAAKAKAAGLLEALRKNPTRFEELAFKESQDPGSATKGGDLGSFGRGAMVKPFEDTAFTLKVNQISDLVESEFGFHIIKVTEISGKSVDYKSLSPQIKGDLLFQKAQAKFTEKAEEFSNMVYEQSTSLEPIAKAFGTQVVKSDWFTREEGAKYFKNDKIMNVVFSDEVLKERRNSEAIEISPNNLVSARVVDYEAVKPRTYDEVKGGIKELLTLEAANKLAIAKGSATLKALQAGKNLPDIDWISDVTVDRKDAQGLTDLSMTQVFKTNVKTLPGYSGAADVKQGYLLVRVTDVISPVLEDVEVKKRATQEFTSALAAEYLRAYKQSLRLKNNVMVNNKLLAGSTID
jgi:peptidyl-prolyl cis-trans isomerase D